MYLGFDSNQGRRPLLAAVTLFAVAYSIKQRSWLEALIRSNVSRMVMTGQSGISVVASASALRDPSRNGRIVASLITHPPRANVA